MPESGKERERDEIRFSDDVSRKPGEEEEKNEKLEKGGKRRGRRKRRKMEE